MKFTTSRTKRKFILFIIAGLVLLGAVAYSVYFTNKRKHDYIFVQVQAFQTANGWGYQVLTDGKVYIKQDFIPAIPGRHGFHTKEQALLVGNKVVEKIEHKQLPVISLAELKAMKIIDDSLRVN